MAQTFGRVAHSSSTGQWQYPTYNALGQRVEDYQGTASTSMKLYYPRDISGDRTGIWDDHSSVGWVGWDVYWSQVAGQRLNMGGSSAYIDHADAVGSTVMETDPAGSVQWDMTYYPWGQIWQQTGTRQTGVYAGLDWQVNDPLIPSATRELSPALGRWMTPDALGGNIMNPQSLNRYAYALNNPTTLNDPSGLQSGPPPGQLYQEFLRALDMCPVCAYMWGQNPFFGLDALTTGEGIEGGEWFPGYFSAVAITALPVHQFGFMGGGVFDTPASLGGPTGNMTPCLAANITQINRVSDLDVSSSNLAAPPFNFNGGKNFDFSVPGASPSELPPGRYSSSFFDFLTGIGHSLHVPGPGGTDPSTYGIGPDGAFTFTTHIDSAYSTWHTPIGAFIHWYVDVRDKGAHRGGC